VIFSSLIVADMSLIFPLFRRCFPLSESRKFNNLPADPCFQNFSCAARQRRSPPDPHLLCPVFSDEKSMQFNELVLFCFRAPRARHRQRLAPLWARSHGTVRATPENDDG
jgi:hypothetical protein